jgi:hypothetical protein
MELGEFRELENASASTVPTATMAMMGPIT